jgi:excisionase family DNA binding protein
MSGQEDEAITLPLFSDVGWLQPSKVAETHRPQRWVCPPPSRAHEGTARLPAPRLAPASSTQASVPERNSPPEYLTAEEAAAWLRTTRKAIYVMAERGQLPGVTRIGRRLLVRRDDLRSWLDEKRAASPEGKWR